MTSVKQAIPLWFEWCNYQTDGEPVVQPGHGLEDKQPWRKGYCLILRAPFTRHAIALGVWTGRQPTADDGDGPMLQMRQMEKFW